MASFSVSITPRGSTSADLTASFTGGSSSYAYNRAIDIYIDGVSYSWAEASNQGGNSYFSDTLEGFDPDTTYSYTVYLMSWSSGGWISTGYSDSGTFSTPSALTLTLTPTSSTIAAVLAGFEDVNYERRVEWTLTRTDTTPGTVVATTTTYVSAHSSSTSHTFGSLTADKPYSCLCQIYRSSDSSHLRDISGSTRTTQGGTVYIYNNGAWHAATPYIYSNGQWNPASVSIYNNGGWH